MELFDLFRLCTYIALIKKKTIKKVKGVIKCYFKHSQVYLEIRVVGQKATEGKSIFKAGGEIQDTIMFKIPAQHLPETCVTLNRKLEIFS